MGALGATFGHATAEFFLSVAFATGCRMKTMMFAIFLPIFTCSYAAAQTGTPISDAERNFNYQLQAGQLEEIAMCHHAIKAVHHDGLAFDQNPYYRYILNSPQGGSKSNVYPIPKRCKSLETDWVLGYTNLPADAKASQDKIIHDEVGMTISEMATDAQFLTIVINKMDIEGDKAMLWDDRDKDIPQR